MAKSKYTEDFPKLAEMYARNGLSDKQIAENLRISQETFYQYVKHRPEFSEALKRGKAPIDFEVENALLKRAMGYEYEEESTEYVAGIDENGKIKPTIKEKRIIKKQVPPDTGAAIFWLTNRQKDRWKQKQHIDHTTNDKEIGRGVYVSPEEMEAIIKKLNDEI
jgi:DNA-binding XRE family transcriptional regulator